MKLGEKIDRQEFFKGWIIDRPDSTVSIKHFVGRYDGLLYDIKYDYALEEIIQLDLIEGEFAGVNHIEGLPEAQYKLLPKKRKAKKKSKVNKQVKPKKEVLPKTKASN